MAKFGITLSWLTFGQLYLPGRDLAKFGTTLVRCTPKVQTSLGKVWYYFKQVDLWPDVPPIKTSHCQVWYYFEQADL